MLQLVPESTKNVHIHASAAALDIMCDAMLV